MLTTLPGRLSRDALVSDSQARVAAAAASAALEEKRIDVLGRITRLIIALQMKGSLSHRTSAAPAAPT